MPNTNALGDPRQLSDRVDRIVVPAFEQIELQLQASDRPGQPGAQRGASSFPKGIQTRWLSISSG